MTKVKLLTAMEISVALGISPYTLNNWYRWYQNPKFKKPDGLPKLPEYEQSAPRATRYWKESSLPALQEFQKALPKGRGGIMGDMNALYWGERGVRALSNKKHKKATDVIRKEKK